MESGLCGFHFFDGLPAEHVSRFEKDYGFLRPIVEEVVERYLDCGDSRSGFARILSASVDSPPLT
jgi:hypothetical protein